MKTANLLWSLHVGTLARLTRSPSWTSAVAATTRETFRRHRGPSNIGRGRPSGFSHSGLGRTCMTIIG
jgi:hypothetical protein